MPIVKDIIKEIEQTIQEINLAEKRYVSKTLIHKWSKRFQIIQNDLKNNEENITPAEARQILNKLQKLEADYRQVNTHIANHAQPNQAPEDSTIVTADNLYGLIKYIIVFTEKLAKKTPPSCFSRFLLIFGIFIISILTLSLIIKPVDVGEIINNIILPHTAIPSSDLYGSIIIPATSTAQTFPPLDLNRGYYELNHSNSVDTVIRIPLNNIIDVTHFEISVARNYLVNIRPRNIGNVISLRFDNDAGTALSVYRYALTSGDYDIFVTYTNAFSSSNDVILMLYYHIEPQNCQRMSKDKLNLYEYEESNRNIGAMNGYTAFNVIAIEANQVLIHWNDANFHLAWINRNFDDLEIHNSGPNPPNCDFVRGL